ncbi:MAG TPA: hypothetical protein VLI05_06445 [Candidatus Saccharimonadia bacterium]|nr:hypothetical protein [Candidatus Saccharimonadia bacterium]
MTKYVVNSGGIFNGGDMGRAFFNEVIKGLGSSPIILMCFFASPREEWQERFPKYTDGFKAVLSDRVDPTFELALPEKFAAQVAACDALYMHGGDNDRIMTALRQYDLPKTWDNKVVATNSASSIALAAHSWTCDERKCVNGLGILPIRFIAHYQSNYGADDPRGPIDWQKGYDELAAYGGQSLPIYALKEGELKVFEG